MEVSVCLSAMDFVKAFDVRVLHSLHIRWKSASIKITVIQNDTKNRTNLDKVVITSDVDV